MRLAAQAKMGYYPTPQSIIPIITRYLERSRQGLIRALDPCTGEGTAIYEIATHLQAESYGIEIDYQRGAKAKEVLNRCLVTDYQDTKISHGAFSLLFLNPPYDWAAREEEIDKSERYERTFLRDCTPYLCSDGVLAYLIPQRRLDTHIAKMLSYRFERLGVYRFPEAEYKAFKQLAIFGVLKKRPEKDDTVFEYLRDCGAFKAIVPYLPQVPPETYQVPVTPSKASFVFSSRKIDRQDLALEIEQHGLFGQFAQMTRPRRFSEKVRPIMPLRHGHLAQILACGLMNGIVWDSDKRRPLLVKGITKKVVNHTVEVQGETEKHIETDQIKILINAFNQKGELLTIE